MSSPGTEWRAFVTTAAGTKLSRIRVAAKASGLVNVFALQLWPLLEDFLYAHPTSAVSEN